MSHPLSELLELLHLEKKEAGLFIGHSQNLGMGRVFGGQVIGQALSAARQSLPSERQIHSFHSYFLREGDISKPIFYEVETLRDGNSFSARRVSAVQQDQAIFYMTLSAQSAEQGFEHQNTPPEVPAPESLIAESVLAKKLVAHLPTALAEPFLAARPIEIRPVTVHNPFQGQVAEAKRYVWMRASGELPDDINVHQALLGYASDFNFLPTALQPHGVGFLEAKMQVATIDHAMWFHRPFRMDEWLLYAVDSPSASNGRGLVRGEFYTRDGLLVASTAQEGLIRRRP